MAHEVVPCAVEALGAGGLVVAAKRGTSVSALVALELDALVADDARYEEARGRASELMERALRRGRRSWQRDELHDR